MRLSDDSYTVLFGGGESSPSSAHALLYHASPGSRPTGVATLASPAAWQPFPPVVLLAARGLRCRTVDRTCRLLTSLGVVSFR